MECCQYTEGSCIYSEASKFPHVCERCRGITRKHGVRDQALERCQDHAEHVLTSCMMTYDDICVCM